MKHFPIIILLSLLVSVMSCEKKAEIQTRDYPYIITQQPIIDSTEVNFSAELLNAGTQKILAYGFVWSILKSPTIADGKQLFDGNLDVGMYNTTVKNGLIKGQKYYVRAYIKTDKLEVYGNEIPFISLGSLSPRITGLSPDFGPIGTRVEINGENFSSSNSGNIVKFGSHVAVVDSAHENKLIVRVPDISKQEKVKISVETAGMQTTSADLFDMWYPWLQKNRCEFAGKNSVGFSIQNFGYLINSNTVYMFKYTPETDTWQYDLNLPEKSGESPLAFSANGKGYALLENGFWEFNPLTDSWIKKNSFPGTRQSIRRYIFGMSINGNIYIGNGGINYAFWEYNTTQDYWIRKADFIQGLESSFGNYSFSADNKGYLGLNMFEPVTNILYEYDPNLNFWLPKSQCPTIGANGFCSFTINENVYAGLGPTESEWGGVSSAIWRYDSQKDIWTKYHSCPTNMMIITSFSINNKGYLVSESNNLWEFDPSKN